jgi:hypothetical protein
LFHTLIPKGPIRPTSPFHSGQEHTNRRNSTIALRYQEPAAVPAAERDACLRLLNCTLWPALIRTPILPIGHPLPAATICNRNK